jgi:tripeptide aminopeptidase
MQILINGVSAHPGFAKNKMQSAIKIASEIIAALPKDRLSPESTHQKEGFVHPVNIQGQVENAQIDLIIRDFEDEKLKDHENEVKNIANKVIQNYPAASIEFKITEQYRNMKKVIDLYPKISDYALKAIERAGIKPLKRSIRGGTDGSRLSFMGLPCPNIFAGEHAFHGKQEWVSEQDMQAAVRTIINLAMIWEEEA